jgi:hypothetical protein
MPTKATLGYALLQNGQLSVVDEEQKADDGGGAGLNEAQSTARQQRVHIGGANEGRRG